MQVYKISGLPIAMVPCLHQKNIYIHRKPKGCRAQEYYHWVGANREQTSTGLQITRIHMSPYRSDNAKFPIVRGFLSPWFRVCNKAIFISKGSFRDAESKNIVLGLMQKGYKLLLGFKLAAFIYRHIGPTMQIPEISGLPIAMVPCLHRSNIYIKRKL